MGAVNDLHIRKNNIWPLKLYTSLLSKYLKSQLFDTSKVKNYNLKET